MSDGNVLLSGIVAGSQAEGLKYASGVRFMSTAGRATANLLCHPIGLGRIILSDKTAIKLGATFTLLIGYPTPGVQSDKEIDFDSPAPPPLPPPPEPAEAKRMELISPFSKASLSALEAFNTQRTSFNSSTSASRVATFLRPPLLLVRPR